MTRGNTDWFRDCKWGLFFHYLGTRDMLREDYNAMVESFDVIRFAEQVTLTQAGYCIFTLGQLSGHWCSPNAAYDRIVGTPSKCSPRDLIWELAEELAAHDIALLVYLPGHAPWWDRHAVDALKCTPRWDMMNEFNIYWSNIEFTPQDDVDDRLTVFQRHWEAVIREWSLRWGGKVRGWWFDGCYLADRMYRHDDEPNFKSFTDAARAGNPGSIVAFNGGIFLPPISMTPYEDYTAGEVVGPLPVRSYIPGKEQLVDRWVNGTQLHLLVCGEDATITRFSPDLIAAYTRHVNEAHGVVSWDTTITGDGAIPPDRLNRLIEAGKVIRGAR